MRPYSHSRKSHNFSRPIVCGTTVDTASVMGGIYSNWVAPFLLVSGYNHSKLLFADPSARRWTLAGYIWVESRRGFTLATPRAYAGLVHVCL